MCDSDEDEFLSASEGEYDESDVAQEIRLVEVEEENEKPEVEASEAPKIEEDASGDDGLISEASPIEAMPKEAPEEAIEAPEDPLPSEDQETTSSSKESLLEEPVFSQSGGSTPASLSSEKQRLLEEVVKETLPSEPVPDSVEKESQASSEDTEKSHDDGGWDDFGVEADPIIPVPSDLTEKEDKKEVKSAVKVVPEPEIPKKEEKKSEKKVEKKDEKVEASPAEDAAGWDDWDEDNSSTPAASGAKKESFDGWDDWSLIDQKKVLEEKKKEEKKGEETDPWFQEQLKPEAPVEKKKAGGWGWGGLVSAVGETLSQTIETSLGLPSAEEAARMHSQMQKKQQEGGVVEKLQETKIHEDPSPSEPLPSLSQPLSSGFGLFSGLVSGGIDVLESIGKKTFEAVTVKDENRGRRRMIFGEESGQNLSDVLKELKERQERELPFQMGAAAMAKQTPDVASVFGRSEGMAHLEALEMLSSNRPKASPKFEREYVSALSSIDSERVEDGDFSDLLLGILKRINLPYEPTTLTNCDTEIDNRLAWCDGKEADELFSDAVTALVDFTAASVQVVSKLSNLLLIIRQDVNSKDFINLCALLSQRVNFIASRYVDCLSVAGDQGKIDDLVTQLHVESSVAVDFIKQAHRLLTPMFQSL